MLNISDLEEKKLIVAYSMAGNKKHVGQMSGGNGVYGGKTILALMVGL